MTPPLSLRTSKHFAEYEAVINALEPDLGPGLRASMRYWCGLEPRPNPLDFWEVYLVEAEGSTVGLGGLYRRPGEPESVLWLGWLGIMPQLRNRGYATAALQLLRDRARELGAQKLYVYTDRDNPAAHALYQRAGFEFAYDAGDASSLFTSEPSELVLSLSLT